MPWRRPPRRRFRFIRKDWPQRHKRARSVARTQTAPLWSRHVPSVTLWRTSLEIMQTRIILAVTVAESVAGNLALGHGMKLVGDVSKLPPMRMAVASVAAL